MSKLQYPVCAGSVGTNRWRHHNTLVWLQILIYNLGHVHGYQNKLQVYVWWKLTLDVQIILWYLHTFLWMGLKGRNADLDNYISFYITTSWFNYISVVVCTFHIKYPWSRTIFFFKFLLLKEITASSSCDKYFSIISLSSIFDRTPITR